MAARRWHSTRASLGGTPAGCRASCFSSFSNEFVCSLQCILYRVSKNRCNPPPITPHIWTKPPACPSSRAHHDASEVEGGGDGQPRQAGVLGEDDRHRHGGAEHHHRTHHLKPHAQPAVHDLCVCGQEEGFVQSGFGLGGICGVRVRRAEWLRWGGASARSVHQLQRRQVHVARKGASGKGGR